MVSIKQPNRIIEAFTPNSATSAATAEMPLIPAINTIINDADMAYSTHRNRFCSSNNSRW